MKCWVLHPHADWFLCLFCTSLPAETAARVWDALLHEGTKVCLVGPLASPLSMGACLQAVGRL